MPTVAPFETKAGGAITFGNPRLFPVPITRCDVVSLTRQSLQHTVESEITFDEASLGVKRHHVRFA